jgi:hypothetical protein
MKEMQQNSKRIQDRVYTLVGHSMISHGLHYPKDLGATVSSSYILGLCGGLCDKRLFVS